MEKQLTGDNVIGLVGTAASNYIQEIYDGTNTHAVAVKHGITFYDGKTDTTGVTWDGIQDLQIIIPTISDIITDPVRLVGVMDELEDTLPTSPDNGDLIYIGVDGYTIGQEVCEAGDMAIYYNNAWHVISGENQITINTTGATVNGNDTLFSLTGTAKTVLTVEGKTLSLNIDYTDIKNHIEVVKDGSTFNVANGTVTVGSMNIGLTKTSASSKNIAEEMTIDLPLTLTDGTVTIAEKVLEASNFTFTSGSFPTATMNSASISVTASTDISVSGSFLTGATKAIGGVSIEEGSQASNDLAYVASLVTASGHTFATGIRPYVSTGENPDASTDVVFEIPGSVTVTGASTFATGFGEASASGDVVSSVAVGAVTVGASSTGNVIVTGLSGGTSTVITGVTIGSVVSNASTWFYSGLTEGNDVVTDVTLGTVTLVSGNNTAGMTSNAVVSASVSNHVLSFTTDSFMKPVDVSWTGSSISKKGFSKSGVALDGFSKTSDVLTFGGINQASTSVSYKSLETSSINIGLGSATKYVLDKDSEHTVSESMGYVKLSVTDAVFTSGSPSLTNKGITAYIPADSVAVGLSGGTLPSLAIAEATGTLTGSVGTSLNTSSVSWFAVASSMSTIAGADTYALTSDSSATGLVGDVITVASASTYGISGATVTIASGNFVTDVEVSGVTVSTKTNA